MKKVLLLGTVSCIAGIVTAGGAGCSSSETTVTTTDGGSDAKPDRIVPEASDDDAGQCPVQVQGTAADLDMQNAWKPPPTGTNGSCTTDDLTKFEANLKDTSAQLWTDYGKGLSDSCVKCAITSDAADKWASVVYTADSNGEKGFVNWGACYGYLDGDACGKAIQYAEFCLAAACDQCAPSGTANDQCVQDALAQGGPCGEFGATVQSACKNLAKDDPKCSKLIDAVTTMCGPATITDGGTDGDADMDADQ